MRQGYRLNNLKNAGDLVMSGQCIRDGGICGIGGFCNECPRKEEIEESNLIDAALDAALKKSTKLIQRFPKWISVDDHLPDDESGYKVLVYANDIVSSWTQILNHNGKYWVHNGDEEFPPTVTHWMPLPSPPEAIKEHSNGN